MKRFHPFLIAPLLCAFFVSCATIPPDRYNTQRGAAIGAGAGALIGQAIGGNTEGTLIGLAAGTILGGLMGNAVDQDYEAAREAARSGKQPVVYYDENGRAVETIPEGSDDPNCRRVRKRVWEDGKLVKETVEETCESSPPEVRYDYPAPPPPSCYGWWGWPWVPRISLYYGRSYCGGHYRPPQHRIRGCR
jgi:hypothetical protein